MSSSERQQRAAVSSNRPSGPGHQRQATKAAEDRLAVEAHKNIGKAVTDRRCTEDMAIADEWQIRGQGDPQQATLPSGWDTAPASASSSEQQLAAARRQPAEVWQQPAVAASSSEQQWRAAAGSSS